MEMKNKIIFHLQIYSVVLKEMEYLMEEFEDTEGSLWCKFIAYEATSSCLLMEDLKVNK